LETNSRVYFTICHQKLISAVTTHNGAKEDKIKIPFDAIKPALSADN
jgi:hypothetical protein